MRNLLLLLVMTVLSCTGQSQNLNREISGESKKSYLLGEINKEGLLFENYKTWFLSGYNEYKPNQEIVDKIQKKLKDYNISIFMGTWCGDSRREVPRFYKLLEDAKFPLSQLTVVAVSRETDMYKQSPNHEEKGLNIHRVPIFIFYKNGKEVNRIVEHPVKSLEEDIHSILNDNYTSNYYLVTEINKIIDDPNFYDKALKSVVNYKMLAKNMYELNTYSKILTTTNRADKAIDVLKLNTKLFQENPAVYVSLANALLKNDTKTEALENYEKAYQLNPKNSNVKNSIDQLKSELSGSGN